ncbi:MAG: TatD family hydrolase [Candidatus Sungiibacteriota bacterium]
MSTLKLIDVHTHIQFAAFEKDQGAVIQRALDGGVWLVNVGTQKDTSVGAVKIAEQFPEGVYATVGLHPIHTEKSYHDPQELGTSLHSQVYKDDVVKGFTSRGEEFDYDYYKKLAAHPKVVAIGECGLDYYRLGQDSKEKQEAAFLKQIELSAEVKKPLMIHCRNAFADLIRLLQATSYKLQARPGIIHFFSGTKEDAKELLGLGFSFSFGGVITFARDYDEVIKYLPLDRILLETDAPYVAPTPHRGKRNEPAYVIEVAKKIAELKGLSFEEIAAKTTDNAQKLFGI